MKLTVIAKKFGNYVKGDTIEMHDTTAEACIKKGVVEKFGAKKPKAKKEVKTEK